MEMRSNERFKGVKFGVENFPEHENVADMFDDKEMVNDIVKDIPHNSWAWCCITVICKVNGLDEIQGRATLGGCNYSSEEEFLRDEAYMELCREAYYNLLGILEKASKSYRLLEKTP